MGEYIRDRKRRREQVIYINTFRFNFFKAGSRSLLCLSVRGHDDDLEEVDDVGQ